MFTNFVSGSGKAGLSYVNNQLTTMWSVLVMYFLVHLSATEWRVACVPLDPDDEDLLSRSQSQVFSPPQQGVFAEAAVVSLGAPCAEIGK